MKCLILGAGGFIGSTVAKIFINNGIPVRLFGHKGFDLKSRKTDDKNVEWYFGDFLNRDDIKNALGGCSCVIHLITTTVPSSSQNNIEHDIDTNLKATIVLLDEMKRNNVRKIIFSSSGGTVYGESITHIITEDHPTNPIVSYGIVKLAIEKYLLLYNLLHDLDPIILRISNPFGNDQKTNKQQGLVGVLFDAISQDQTFNIWGDGKNIRDYVHIYDVASAFLKAYQYNGTKRVFNIGSGVGYSVLDIIEKSEKIFQKKINLNFLHDRGFDVKKNILDSNLAKNELGWFCQYNLIDFLSGH